MAEYIELTDLWSSPFDYIIDTCGSSVAQGFVDRVNEIKPADVRPVVRGHWEIQAVGIDGEDVFCSVCKCGSNRPYWPFCPMCGADMRDGDTDD